MGAPVRVSVVVVNYNSSDLLRSCLRSVHRCAAVSTETIVVDNASDVFDAEALKRAFPSAAFFSNGANLGFAKAVNQGIRASRGEFVLLLNPDAVLSDGTIEELVSTMDADERIGACGAGLYWPDGRAQDSAWPAINGSPLVYIAHALGISHVWLWLRDSIGRRLKPKRHARPREVAYVCGACLMVRRQVIDEVGPLDERFFLYAEDKDWCRRIRAAGWRVVHCPGAKALHVQGGSGGSSDPSVAVEARRAASQFIGKYHGPIPVLLFRAAVFLGHLPRWAFRLVSPERDRVVRRRRSWALMRWALTGCGGLSEHPATGVEPVRPEPSSLRPGVGDSIPASASCGSGARRGEGAGHTVPRDAPCGDGGQEALSSSAPTDGRRAQPCRPQAGGRAVRSVVTRPRIRVLQLVDSQRLGGAQRLVLDLARRLDRSRYDVAACSIQGGSALGPLFREAGRECASLDCGKYSLRGPFRLARLCKHLRPHIVHAHLFQAHVFAGWLRATGRVPTLVAHLHSPLIGAPWSVLERLELSRADALIAVSSYTAERYRAGRGVDERTMCVVPNGVDTEVFHPSSRAEARRALGVRDDLPIVGFVGRLAQVKGPDVLLQAALCAPLARLEVQFVFVGDGPMRAQLERASEAEHTVSVHGPREDVHQVLPALDLLCLPSRDENLPMAALEAMVCGVPVLATAVGGVPEAVEHGRTGWLVPPEDPEALAGAILQLLDDEPLRRRLAQAGMESVRERFDIRHTVRAIEGVYEEVLSRDC